MTCWVRQHVEGAGPCRGRLVRGHLIPKQKIKRAGGDPWDERAWVVMCGGLTGIGGHHGAVDGLRLRVPRAAIPQDTEALAAELGLSAWLDRFYG
jgi:hypothetical protein